MTDPVERAPSTTRVLAVLVVHDGEPWLARTLEAVAAQTHADLEVVAVDNGSTDGSRRVLLDHLHAEQVLVADRDLGFGAAVSMALDARPADEAPYVLLLHDDIALEPDAVATLASALDEDPRLAIAGPKLLDWDDPRRLQAVGWTVDVTGRADSGVDEGELDQGQRDVDRRSLYVSTGGMLLRRGVFDALGRFDRRYHLFRDDLDLCWRAWLAGHDVEVIPQAVALHAASATTYQRLGQTRFIGPRYFAERNTLATLLKNYGAARLLGVVPLFFLVGVAKVLGFVLTRRLSDAWQTVRAWLWNLLHLRETWRLRGLVQQARTRSDADLRELFGRIVPRVQAYGEAIAEWVAGGDAGTAADARPGITPEPETATVRLRRFVRRQPIPVTGVVLGLLFTITALPLLQRGALRGGEFAPWPARGGAFFGDHLAAWHEAAGLGTSLPPSPAQALLGVWHVLVLGSSYLAPRLLLLGLMAVAWVLALRAAQRYSERRLPRVAAATAYVLSPPSIAAFVTGQLSALVVLAVLPGLVAAVGTTVQRRSSPARAWRAAAAAALLGGVAGAFAPVVLPVLILAGIAVAAVVLQQRSVAERGALAVRLGLATFGPLVLLAPWSFELWAADGPLRGGVGEVVTEPLWRWAALSPDVVGFPGLLAGLGFVLAGVLGLLLGWRKQPTLVAGLWGVAVLGALVAWWAGWAGATVWAGLPLVVTAAAFAGLLAVAFTTAEAQLAHHAFGWRQLAVAVTAVAVAASLGSVTVDLLRQPLDAYTRTETLPSFITASATEDDPFRVLVLAAGPDGTVDFEVVPGAGPTMAGYGVPLDGAGTTIVERAVAELVAGTDPSAAASLGRLGIRYLVVPDGGETQALDDALRRQLGIEPRPVARGRVLAVSAALPRAAALPVGPAEAFVARGEVPEGTIAEPVPATDGVGFAGQVHGPGALVVTEAADPGWRATSQGRQLERLDLPTVAFALSDGAQQVEISHAGGLRRGIALVVQLLLVLLVISLVLRPPGALTRRGVPQDGGGDPAAMSGALPVRGPAPVEEPA